MTFAELKERLGSSGQKFPAALRVARIAPRTFRRWAGQHFPDLALRSLFALVRQHTPTGEVTRLELGDLVVLSQADYERLLRREPRITPHSPTRAVLRAASQPRRTHSIN